MCVWSAPRRYPEGATMTIAGKAFLPKLSLKVAPGGILFLKNNTYVSIMI